MPLTIENRDRGEVKITICKQDYLLSLNFAAISRLQTHFCESILIICAKFSSGQQTPEQLASIVLLTSGQEKEIDLEDMIDAIMLEGLIKIQTKVNDFLAKAVNGGRVGKPKAGK